EEILLYKTDHLVSDTDQDNLTDGNEINNYGTSPFTNDTDSDGLTDYLEIVHEGTDPLNPDTDGDGFSDGIEKLFGTDPLDSDDHPPLPETDVSGNHIITSIILLLTGLSLLAFIFRKRSK
ncbi:MAG: LPXTG cell wall anchor domain-containing protein, partial [Asgard group archaeon]|nr:LPXTG cell wall anchor domain-containing protein [Asgard group archaeon]